MNDENNYVPAEIWVWNKDSGGAFASLNRPVSGATSEKPLPIGRHPIQLYSIGSPNGQKITILLEELLARGIEGAEYDAWLIEIMQGDQFTSGFVEVNPNSKIPAMVDRSGSQPVHIFESGAILMYLAEKFGAFLPEAGAARAQCLSWLFWQVGSTPLLGGGFGHFYTSAPTKIRYAIDRYALEVKRQMDVLDRRLADNEFTAGPDYTIADMAIWPWYGGVATGQFYDAVKFLGLDEYRHVQRWTKTVGERPAVRRGIMVNRTFGDPATQLRERHDASDFDRIS
ncbi:glutathione-dependent disulfide-bond oxidoreductase [Sphingobium sp. AN558]|uniref:glutathione-dependent disulfide-bond oxidoreductase n=1 Tax=Sphingobium sp. AN558 TaxID=3133442 RepID=UPI0030BE4B0C